MERRIVDDILHKISREIVNRAKEEKAMIVLGNLKGIRRHNKGRKLSKFIEYKALWEGIATVRVREANTSKLCSCCSSQGLRRSGKFVCSKCGVELNADYNGALNILKRALGYMSRVRGGLTHLELGRMKLKLTNPESPGFSRGECQCFNSILLISFGCEALAIKLVPDHIFALCPPPRTLKSNEREMERTSVVKWLTMSSGAGWSIQHTHSPRSIGVTVQRLAKIESQARMRSQTSPYCGNPCPLERGRGQHGYKIKQEKILVVE